MEERVLVPLESEIRSTLETVTPNPGNTPKWKEIKYKRIVCTSMFMTAQLTTASMCNKLRCHQVMTSSRKYYTHMEYTYIWKLYDHNERIKACL